MTFPAKPRLAVISTHPIQYNAPLFSCLAKRGVIDIKVFYTWGEKVLQNKYDPGFGKIINWDIPLLEGYPFQFLRNTAKDPGTHHFNGIVNPGIVEEIRAWKPDCILVYGWKFRSHLKVMRAFKGVTPVFFRGDSTLLDDQSRINTIIRKISLRWVYRHVDKVFYVGAHNKAYFLESGLKADALIRALHTVDNDFFFDKTGTNQAEAQKWREQLGIPADSIVFLFAGKLEAKKSPGLLLDVFQRSGKFDRAHLILVGNGRLEQELKKKGAAENIHFIDFQNQSRMPVVYRLGDVYVLPSGGPGETWGLAMNEAMASGRPVLASDKCGGAVELIREGVTGYIFRSGDAEDLESKMSALMAPDRDLAEMGRQALNEIRAFSIETVAREIENAVIASTIS